MQFKQFLKLLENNQQGTYVSTHVNKEHAKIIIDILEEHGIKNLVHPDELHVTIIYSKTPCVAAYSLLNVKDFKANFSPYEFDIFGKDEKVLVIKGWSSILEGINEKLKKRGATSDFEGYNPHITVAIDTDIDEVSAAAMKGVIREIEEKFKIFDFQLEGLTVKPITNDGYTIKMNDGRVIQK